MADQDILSMSDEEFAKLPTPPPVSTDDGKQPDAPASDADQDNTQVDQKDEPKGDETPEAQPKDQPEEPESKDQPSEQQESKDEKPAEEPKAPETKDAPVAPGSQDVEDTDKDEPAKKDKPADDSKKDSEYEAFFKRVMAPFKANGKTIQLTSADEVIQLMQMGANYTKKMQSIQQNKKFLMMLENNGLLDENKLSFLIDLDKKDPEAVKKLLKDSKIDPSEIDTSEDAKYTGGAHAVTDQEAALASAIDELVSSPEGKATLQSVHSTWDAASKKVLYDDPRLLGIIHSQHENGIYAKIVAEMERRKVLGQVDVNAPFLQTYKAIGDEMNAKGAFGVVKPSAAPSKPAGGTPVAVKAAKTPAVKAAEAAKVRAAASPRSASQTARSDVNVLAMSDDEFLKKYGNKY